jgi:hypothetical protein
VDVSHICARDRLEEPLPPQSTLTWLTPDEWAGIKYNSSNLALLDASNDDYREARSIGITDSRCQMVGQGIFRVRQEATRRSSFFRAALSRTSQPDPRDDLSTWTSLVARSILYRVRHEGGVRGGQSGTPVCVLDDSSSPPVAKVAGFASFVQMASDVQRYDLEGDKLYKRLQEGRVAFYGAFQVPSELREGYRII